MAVALAPIETGDKSAEALESARKSMKDLDMALIMGGPGASDIVLAFVDCIEPLILSANKDGDKDEDSSSYIVSADVPPHAPSINEAFAVERVASISFADFKKKFFKTDTACVVTGAIESWPARGRWHDLRYFRDNFGHRTVPLELGRLENGRKKAGWREEATLLRDLIEQHLVPSNAKCRGRAKEANASASASSAEAEAAAEAAAAAAVSDPDHEVAYLAQHGLFEQVPRLANDIAVPEYCACGDFAGANAWFGTAGTVTPLHHDSQDNLLAQVVGYKYIRLYDHLQTRFLYVSKGGRGEGISAQGNISPVNCEAPDHHAHPLLREAKYKEVLLGPGDMLFIPARHWHYVRSLSPSFSVNFWF